MTATAAQPTLARVRVERSRVRGTCAGLRPFRASGFVVRAERVGDRTVVHHYGHGGCGITLSWGTGRLVVEHALAQAERRVAVLGCGAVGLATARLLQTHGFAVTIYARALPPHTTSDQAGAFWAPFSLLAAEQLTPELATRISGVARASHAIFSTLDERHGVRRLSMYYLDPDSPELSVELTVAGTLFEGPLLAPGEHPFGARFAHRFPGMVIDPRIYLAALLADVRANGGRVTEQEFASFEDVSRVPERLVVNCMGLGATALTQDDELTPVKGQLVLLEPQREIDYMVVSPAEGLYMLPRADAVVLGTTHDVGITSATPDEAATNRLLEAHGRLFA